MEGSTLLARCRVSIVSHSQTSLTASMGDLLSVIESIIMFVKSIFINYEGVLVSASIQKIEKLNLCGVLLLKQRFLVGY